VAGVVVKMWNHLNGHNLEVTTGANGEYIIKDVAPSVYTARIADRPAGIWTDGVVVRAGLEQITRAEDLYLKLPQSISGTIRDVVTRKPVAGVGIHFSTADRNWDSIVTDARGNFRLFVVPRKITVQGTGSPERYYALGSPAANGKVPEHDIKAGEHLDHIDFTVRSAPRFAGRLLGADGQPARGVLTYLVISWERADGQNDAVRGGDFSLAAEFTRLNKTDEIGEFSGYARRPFQPPGQNRQLKITLLARTPDGKWGLYTQRLLPLLDKDFFIGHFKLLPTTSAELHVHDEAGKPLKGAVPGIAAMVGESYYLELPLPAQPVFETLGQGNFRARGLLPSMSYFFSAKLPGYQDMRSTVSSFVAGADQPRDAVLVRLQRKDKTTVAMLIKRLGSPDRYKREETCRELGELGTNAAAAVPALVDLLKNDKLNTVRYNAAAALGKIGQAARKAVPNLIVALQFDTDGVDREAAKALGLIGDPAAVLTLGEAVKTSKETEVRLAAVISLGQLKVQASDLLPRLLPALKDKDQRVQAKAIEALSTLGKDARTAVPLLIPLLDKGSWEGRAAAAKALGLIGDRAALPDLRRLARTGDDLIYVEVVTAIRKLEKKKEQ
jgi:hypothetical protein